MVDYIKTVAGLSRSLGRRYAPVPNSDRFVEIVDTIVGDEIVTPLGKVRKRGPEQRGRFDVLASDLDPIVADVVPPVITCPLVYMIAENTPLTITLTANEPVTWTKTGGEDSAAFPITGGNTINFTAKDFDNPSDYLLNNTFFGSFRATDAAGNATDFEIVVNITNVLEGAMAAISPTTATVDDAALSSLVVLNLPAMVEGESRSYIPTTGPQFVFNSAGKLIRGLSAFVSGTATGKVRQSRGGVNTDTNVTITLTATPAVTRVIATRGEVPINLGAATTTEAQRRLKLRSVHYFGQQGFTEIQVAFANYAVYNFNDLELSPGNTCDIEGSIEIPDAPTPVVRFKFSNANVATLADGEPLKISDVIPASAFGLSIDQALALADTRFFIKHTRTVPLGGKHVKAAALQTSVVPGDMAVSCDPALDTDPITNPGQLAFGAAPYTLYTDIIPPLAVLGKTRAKQVSVFGAGDSITYGANDLNGAGDGVTRGGHFQRAMHGVNGHHIPFIRAASAGERGLNFINQTKRQMLFPYVTHGYVGYGTNDLAVTGQTPTTIQATLRTIWQSMKAAGIKWVVQNHLYPRTTSSDGWVTKANQGPFSGGKWENGAADGRRALEALITANVGANGLDDWVNYDSVLADPTQTDRWITDGATSGLSTIDGTHPNGSASNTVGHGGMAAVLRAKVALWTPDGVEASGPVIAPVLKTAPVIFGVAQTGSVLTVSNGVWENKPDYYTYQWTADNDPISGAITASYTPTAAVVGKVLDCRVRAVNGAGNVLVITADTAAVLAQFPGTINTSGFATTGQKFGTGCASGLRGTLLAGAAGVGPTFTVDFWIKRSGAPGATEVVIGNTTAFYIGMSTAGKILFQNNVSANTITSPLAYNDNVWHHVRAVGTASGVTLCVDGAPVATSAVACAFSATAVLNVGSLNGLTQFAWNGMTDDLAFFLVALPTTYTVPTAAHAATEDDLNALYPLDNTLSDIQTAAGNAGTPVAVNAVWDNTLVDGGVYQLAIGTHDLKTLSGAKPKGITIKGQPGAILKRVNLLGAPKITFEGVKFQDYNPGFDTTPKKFAADGAQAFEDSALIYGDSAAANITVNNCEFSAADDSSAWTATEWVYKPRLCAILFRGANCTIKNSQFRNVLCGIATSGPGAIIDDNLIEMFSVDGIRHAGNGTRVRRNTLRESRHTVQNGAIMHGDFIQMYIGQSTSGNPIATITDTQILDNILREGIGNTLGLQGIGQFDGLAVDYLVDGNDIECTAPNGITSMGGDGVTITSNKLALPTGTSLTAVPPFVFVSCAKVGEFMRPPKRVAIKDNVLAGRLKMHRPGVHVAVLNNNSGSGYSVAGSTVTIDPPVGGGTTATATVAAVNAGTGALRTIARGQEAVDVYNIENPGVALSGAGTGANVKAWNARTDYFKVGGVSQVSGNLTPAGVAVNVTYDVNPA